MATIFAILASISIWIILMFTAVPFFLLVFLLRFLISRFVPLCSKKVDKIVSRTSSLLFNTNKRKEANIAICIGLEGRVEVEEILKEFESQVIDAKDSNGQLLRPELQQFPISICDYYFWKWDVNFNLKNHIHLLQINTKWDQKFKNAQDILEILEEQVLTGPWPKNRSPWEILVVHNFRDSPLYGLAPPPTGTLLILRAHHVMGDGTTMREIFQDLLRGRNKGRVSQTRYPQEINDNRTAGFKKEFYTYFFGPLHVLKSHLRFVVGNKGVVTNEPRFSKCRRRYNIGVTPTISVDLVKQIRKTQEVSFEAVVLTIFLKAYAKFMENFDRSLVGQLPCASSRVMPRHISGKMINNSTVVFSVLPIKMEGPAFKSVHKSVQEVIKSASPDFMFKLGKLLGSLSTRMRSVDNIVFSEMNGFIGLSNILPFPDELQLGTHKLNTAFLTIGSEDGLSGLFCMTFGCKEGIRFVFNVDNIIAPREKISAEVLGKFFVEELKFWTEEIQEES